jgi:cytidylate kinase
MAILTISREFGSGGREIGRAVTKEFGYEYLNKARILKELGVFGKKWEEWGKGLDEHAPSMWEKHDYSFIGFGSEVRCIFLEYAAKDNVILMERGGNFLLKEVPHAFRIRVVAPLEQRIERIMIREVLDYDTALWLTQQTDHHRSRFIAALYGKQWDDPKEYDAVFNTGIQPIEDVIRAVYETLPLRDQHKTKEAEEWLRLQAAAARVQAGLLTHPHLFVNIVEVTVEGNSLVLKGIVRDQGQRKKVEDIARESAGDIPLKSRLRLRLE